MDSTITPEESVDAAVSNPVSDGQSTPSNSSTDTLVEMESVNITVEASTPPPTSIAGKNETTTDPKPDHVEKIAAAAMALPMGEIADVLADLFSSPEKLTEAEKSQQEQEKGSPELFSGKTQTTQTTKWTSTKTLNENRSLGWI